MSFADLKEFKPFAATVGYVYYLFCYEELVYIGQTLDMNQRIANHRNTGKIFDKVLFEEVPIESLTARETSLIQQHQPYYNKAKNSKSFPHYKIIGEYIIGRKSQRGFKITNGYFTTLDTKNRPLDHGYANGEKMCCYHRLTDFMTITHYNFATNLSNTKRLVSVGKYDRVFIDTDSVTVKIERRDRHGNTY